MSATSPSNDTVTDRTITVGESSSERYELPVEDVLTGRGAILGKSGSGKSNSSSVIVEELLAAGQSVLVVDVEGEYYGLKEEFELLHAGADDRCDVQVGPDHAEKLASLALEERIPVILDLSGYVDESGPGEQSDAARDLVRRTAEALFTTERDLQRPFPIIVEEIHEFVPEGPALDALGQQLVQIAKRGRKRGLGIVGISQRPADVKKDLLTQADWLVWHRLTWDNDTKVVRKILGTDYDDPVQDLADGEAFVQADWADTIERVQFDRKRTFDAGATPGLEDVERPELTAIDGDIVAELEAISADASQRRDEIERLQARLEEKADRIEELEQALQNARDVSNAAQQLADALQDGDDADGVPENFEAQLEHKNERIHDLERERDALQERVDDLERTLERARVDRERVEHAEQIEARFEGVREHVSELAAELDVDVAVGDPADSEDSGADADHVAELEAENERLRERLAAAEKGVTVPTDYEDFVNQDVVQDTIEEAMDKTSASKRYVKGVVATIVQEGAPVSYETIADRLGVSTTSDVSKAASTLETLGLIDRVQQSPAKVDLDLESVAELKEARRRRQEADQLMEDL